MVNTILDIQNVSFTVQDGFTSRDILDNVSCHIKKGECVGISGASGSGKSTLLAVAGTLSTPTRGKVLLVGKDITSMNAKQKAIMRRDHIGFIFQSPQLHSAFTAKEQLINTQYLDRVFPLYGMEKKQVEDRAADLLDRVGLGDRLDAKPSELSGGQRARVGIARALMTSPNLLLVDEPTAALDSARAQEVTELILDITHQDNIATMFVSHNKEQIDQMDRVLYISDGKLSDHK